jgi:hypothetical protein
VTIGHGHGHRCLEGPIGEDTAPEPSKLRSVLDRLSHWDGSELPLHLRRELARIGQRRELVGEQLAEVEAERRSYVAKKSKSSEMVHLLGSLEGVGNGNGSRRVVVLLLLPDSQGDRRDASGQGDASDWRLEPPLEQAFLFLVQRVLRQLLDDSQRSAREHRLELGLAIAVQTAGTARCLRAQLPSEAHSQSAETRDTTPSPQKLLNWLRCEIDTE